MMTLLNMLSALNARLYMITKTVSRAAVEGKCQLGVGLCHGQGTHTGISEVSLLLLSTNKSNSHHP